MSTSSSSSWFKNVFGVAEHPRYECVREMFRIEKNTLGSITLHTVPSSSDGVESRSFHVGTFETPSVKELKTRMKVSPLIGTISSGGGGGGGISGLSFRHIDGEARELHLNPQNEGAVFQAASQFNCLEMPNSSVRPENGITGYSRDRTQGPACALSCPAGTLYRNYFVNGTGQGGNNGQNQLDMLADVGRILGNHNESFDGKNNNNNMYWKMQNGYALPVTAQSMKQLRQKLLQVESNSGSQVNLQTAVTEHLRVGVHWDTEVVRANQSTPYNVAQVYCSALPIGYTYGTAGGGGGSRTNLEDWEPFAQLILNGAYEATLAVAAILARQRNERVPVFLTQVGGGVFGNKLEWISQAINNALDSFQNEPLDVQLVHYHYVPEEFTKSIPERLLTSPTAP